MNEFQNSDLLHFVSKMKRKPNDGNCLFALSLVNRCPVKKRREFLVMKPEEDNESWQKAGCLLLNCEVGQSLGK